MTGPDHNTTDMYHKRGKRYAREPGNMTLERVTRARGTQGPDEHNNLERDGLVLRYGTVFSGAH